MEPLGPFIQGELCLCPCAEGNISAVRRTEFSRPFPPVSEAVTTLDKASWDHDLSRVGGLLFPSFAAFSLLAESRVCGTAAALTVAVQVENVWLYTITIS
jgi:hypothetical protein